MQLISSIDQMEIFNRPENRNNYDIILLILSHYENSMDDSTRNSISNLQFLLFFRIIGVINWLVKHKDQITYQTLE